MHIFIPFIKSGSGSDIFSYRLADIMRMNGLKVTLTGYEHLFQYFPFLLKTVEVPDDVNIIVTNSWNGFALKRPHVKLVVVEHHCVLDRQYKKFRNLPQAFYHETLVRIYEKMSFRAADAVVAVSQYTARSVESVFENCHPRVIYNGIDTDFFCPSAEIISGAQADNYDVCKLLYVGNLSKRKGADLLPSIMDQLGKGFHLKYTAGLREENGFHHHPHMTPLNRLSNEELRKAYREADLLLFPSRFEGFGYAPAEAMACGTPAVVSNTSALPEVIKDDETGKVCRLDHVSDFVDTIKKLAANRPILREMSQKARQDMVERFNLQRMAGDYIRLFQELLKK